MGWPSPSLLLGIEGTLTIDPRVYGTHTIYINFVSVTFIILYILISNRPPFTGVGGCAFIAWDLCKTIATFTPRHLLWEIKCDYRLVCSHDLDWICVSVPYIWIQSTREESRKIFPGPLNMVHSFNYIFFIVYDIYSWYIEYLKTL